MNKPKCKVCSHPKRKDIESKLRAGMSTKKLAVWLKSAAARAGPLYESVSHCTLDKHWRTCVGVPSNGSKVPNTLDDRRKFLEDEAFELIRQANTVDVKDKISLLKCASDLMERAKDRCFCDHVQDHPEVIDMVSEYETAIKSIMGDVCNPCSVKIKSKGQMR